ncbi:U-box domain-containing protein 35-like [Eucalyptus grandis]|uniref:U-box domain-containing protein 35-like n=1 Tax=Eucalyptus grandis TaxID=71139 RepID=UPI0005250315|nr:U-box domain-containing protein 35-like [Eucalyptus grandis]
MVSLRGSNDNVAATGRGGEGGGRERLIAVAIDRDKSSRYALKWAIENVVSSRNQTLKLVHVKCRPSTSPPFPAWSDEAQPDAQTTELFLRFRCYCLRKHVQYEVVVLENSDVAKALVEYVSRHAVDTLLLGTASRKSFSRLFKFADTPNTILKYAPNYCNIYVVGKGKAVSVRSATCPVPNLLTIEETAQVDTLNHARYRFALIIL